jgi:electron transfer flavoprotein beta subunit
MKILVGIKHVPDTETKIKIGGDGTAIDPSGVSKWIISPFDEYALEEALRMRDAAGEGEVVLVCAGPETAQQTIRQGLAMGADRAILVTDDRFDLADGLVRAKALAAVVKEEDPQLVLLGKYGVGTDEGQTGAMLGELLGWPHTFAVSTLEVTEGQFTAEHGIEGAIEVVAGSLPAVITCEKGLNEPRYPSLKGIMQAKKKPLSLKPAAELGIDDAQLAQGKMLIWEALELPPERGGGKILDGAAEESAAELARLLHEDAKVI